MRSVKQSATIGVIALLISATANAQGEGTRHLKESFYTQHELGTLAWIKDAKTRTQAQTFRRSFNVLTDGDCFEFPKRSNYWLAINHRDVERAGQPGFASIRLIYQLPDDVEQSRLYLYRSRGWTDDQGQSASEFRSSRQLAPRYFFEMHETSELSAVDSRIRRHAIQKNTGGFHAYVIRGKLDSWDHSHLLTAKEMKLPKKGSFLADILHNRFVLTSKNNSRKPLIFKLNGYGDWGVKGVNITLDMPGALGARDRVSKRIMFQPHKCS